MQQNRKSGNMPIPIWKFDIWQISGEEGWTGPSNKWCYLCEKEIKLDFTSYTKHIKYEKKIFAALFIIAKRKETTEMSIKRMDKYSWFGHAMEYLTQERK